MTPDDIRSYALELAEEAILDRAAGGSWMLSADLSADSQRAVAAELRAIAEQVAKEGPAEAGHKRVPATPVEISALRALCEQASDGPWSVERDDEAMYTYVRSQTVQDWRRDIVEIHTPDEVWPDFEFIAAARTALPAALDELESLRRIVAAITGVHRGERGDALTQAWQDYEHAYGTGARVPDETIRELAARRQEIRERTLARLHADQPAGVEAIDRRDGTR